MTFLKILLEVDYSYRSACIGLARAICRLFAYTVAQAMSSGEMNGVNLAARPRDAGHTKRYDLLVANEQVWCPPVEEKRTTVRNRACHRPRLTRLGLWSVAPTCFRLGPAS